MENFVVHSLVHTKLAYLFLSLLIPSCQFLHMKAPPRGLPSFMAVWNAPSELCMEKFKVKVDTRLFQIVGSTLKSNKAQNITIFYSGRLGFYPSINEVNGTVYNGGIPQLTNMDLHLRKAKDDIMYYIPSSKQPGLAVIDWEEWRPTWFRNWASKEVYQKHSIEFAQQNDISVTEKDAPLIARDQFESSAKHLMLSTLKLGKLLRPNHLWGFYLFPNCYNHHYKSNHKKYAGHCPEIELLRNDKMSWLWRESTALYPNIYLKVALKSSEDAAMFSRHRIQEAIRLSSLSKYAVPIYMYTRPVFTDRPDEFLSQYDLQNTIGESTALGVDGFVIWGDVNNMTQSKKMCTDMNNYVLNTLNPYIINVTLASKLCSRVLCQNNGLCTRKQWNTSSYLHLNPRHMAIEHKHGKYTLKGQPTIEDLHYFYKHFMCWCYAGRNCQIPSNIHKLREVNVCMQENICLKARFGLHSNSMPQIK